MKRLVVILCFGLLMTACLTTAQRDAVRGAGEVIGSAAPLLPPPFGILAGGLATVLAGIASVGANKVSNDAFQKKIAAPPLIQLATDHASSIMGLVAAVVPALRAAGVIHMSDPELSLLMATLVTPVATKKVMRRKVEKKATPAAPTPTQ